MTIPTPPVWHHPGTLPYPTCCVYMLCLFCWKYDDDVSTIPPNPVRECILSRFSFCFIVGRPLFLTTKLFMGCSLPLALTLTSLFVGVRRSRLPWALVLKGTRCERSYNRFRRWIGPNQEKSDNFKPSRFEPLYQPYFGIWLFASSRCGRIVKKSSRKDSLY